MTIDMAGDYHRAGMVGRKVRRKERTRFFEKKRGKKLLLLRAWGGETGTV
jgi:hypothetical protein